MSQLVGLRRLLEEIRAKSTLPAPVQDQLRGVLRFVEDLAGETPSLEAFRAYSQQQKRVAKIMPRAAKVFLRTAAELVQIGGDAELSAKIRSFVRNWGNDTAPTP